MNFLGNVGSGPMDKWLNFYGDPGHGIRIETLVRRALAEICTVPVLLANSSGINSPLKSVSC